jgi:hypothetical protein
MTVEQNIENSSGHRSTRRVSDKILIAFNFACDQRDVDIAWDLLKVLEFMAARMPTSPTADNRRTTETLFAAYARLWQLLHPEAP